MEIVHLEKACCGGRGMLLVKKVEHRLMLRGAQFRKEHGDWRLTCRMGVDIGREAGCEAGSSISANALGRLR